MNIKYFDVLRESVALRSIILDARRGALSHAYMYVTPDEDALESLYPIVALAVYCKRDMCMRCPECMRVLSENHGDIVHLRPNPKNISVKDVEAVVEGTYVTSVEGGAKLIVIHGADRMTVEAQNKLLKTLEEPPEGVTFVMGATNESAVLDTVKSRSRKAYLDYFDVDTIARALGDGERARVAALCSGGMLGRAERILNDERYPDTFRQVVQLLKNMKRSPDVVRYSDSSLWLQENIRVTLEIMEMIFSEMLGVSTEVREPSNLFGESLPTDFSTNAIVNCIQAIAEMRERLFFNCAYQAVGERLMYKILEVKYKCPL